MTSFNGNSEDDRIRKQKIYLETSIFNFPFVDDAPQYRDETLKLFDEIRAGRFAPITSMYVIDELRKTKDTEKRDRMITLATEGGIEVLPYSEEARRLARVYIKSGIIPQKYPDDALHIAAATVHGADSIISLNFRHIVKHKTMLETEFVNLREGYKRVFIHTPAEVTDNG